MNTVAGLLAGSGLPRTEASRLAAFVLGRGRAFIAAHPEFEIEADTAGALADLFARRRAGEPLAYVTGEREFYGLSLRVGPEVLIPRPETELLVERALVSIAARAAPRILELGTGSGAIAIALALARKDADVLATDISPAALAIARENVRRHGARVRLMESDWFSAPGLEDERFDLVVSNPPYVPEADPHLLLGDVRFEPRRALVGGREGLDCIRRIAGAAPAHLLAAGRLMFEHGWDQGAACVAMLNDLGYEEVIDTSDLAGHPRICEGCVGRPGTVFDRRSSLE